MLYIHYNWGMAVLDDGGAPKHGDTWKWAAGLAGGRLAVAFPEAEVASWGLQVVAP